MQIPVKNKSVFSISSMNMQKTCSRPYCY